MNIPKYDFEIKQGNSGTVRNPDGLVLRLKTDANTPLDLAGADIVFFAHWSGQTRMRLTSTDGHVAVEAGQGRITVPFSAGAFRDVRPGITVEYEIEHRQGTQQRTLLEGKIKITKGVNDD